MSGIDLQKSDKNHKDFFKVLSIELTTCIFSVNVPARSKK